MPPESHGAPDPSVTEVEFSADGADYPFVTVSGRGDCTFELAKLVPRADDRYAEFFNVTGIAPRDVLAAVDESAIVHASVLREYDDGGLLEFVVSGGCPAVDLARLGALPRVVRGVDGTGHIVAEISAEYEPSTVIRGFLGDHPAFEFVAKRTREECTPLFSSSSFEEVARRELTDRQREVVETAFEAGYYQWPRESTGAEVADELGIASATFSEHVHAAERKLLAVLFEQSTGENQRS